MKLMMMLKTFVASAFLVSTVNAVYGRFKLFDVKRNRELVIIEHRATYDLNELGVGRNPQLTVLYESFIKGTTSVAIKLSRRASGGGYETMNRECDKKFPFYATSRRRDPVAFDFSLRTKIKASAKLSNETKSCKDPFAGDRVVFKLVNSYRKPKLTPKPTTPKPVTPQPTTPKPVTLQPTTPQPVTPQPTTLQPVTPEPTQPGPPSSNYGR